MTTNSPIKILSKSIISCSEAKDYILDQKLVATLHNIVTERGKVVNHCGYLINQAIVMYSDNQDLLQCQDFLIDGGILES